MTGAGANHRSAKSPDRKEFLRAGLGAMLLAAAPSTLLAAPQAEGEAGSKETEPKKTPEEKMAARFPQPVKVSYLIGIPVLDENDADIGRIVKVLKTGAGKLILVLAYRNWFEFRSRPVAIPIEVCAMLGKNVAPVDMPRADIEKAPTWSPSGERELDPGDIIAVAVMRR